jgi:TP901 family phage tail tape measure protein
MGKQELKTIISGDARKFNRTMGQVKGAAKRTAKSLAVLGVAGIAKATKDAADFQKQLAEVGTLGGFATNELEGVGNQLLKLGANLGATTDELTGGLYQALSAGVPSDNALSFLETSVRAAKAGISDTETAVDGLTTVINAYGLNADDANKISDQFFATVKAGKTTFGELASNIGKVATTASTVGVSTEQLFASFATLTKQGLSTEEATTRISAAISSLLKPAPALAAVLEDLGFASGEAAVKQLGFQGALDAVANKVDNNNKEIAKLFPSVRALGGVLSLTGSKAALAAADLQALQNSTGATDAAFAILANTGAQTFDRLAATAKLLSVQVGNETLPIINEELQKLQALLDTPEAGQSFKDIADGAAGALEVVKIFATGIKELGELIAKLEIDSKKLFESLVPGGFLISKVAEAAGFQTPSERTESRLAEGVTAEQLAAAREVLIDNQNLKGATTVGQFFTKKLVEDVLRGGSTESVATLNNIYTLMDQRLPAATEGATQ